jgi:hypothetical protein
MTGYALNIIAFVVSLITAGVVVRLFIRSRS